MKCVGGIMLTRQMVLSYPMYTVLIARNVTQQIIYLGAICVK